ncbi:MAG: hypothetical protein SGARI_003001, partial [Bacillariaceae sp.]
MNPKRSGERVAVYLYYYGPSDQKPVINWQITCGTLRSKFFNREFQAGTGNKGILWKPDRVLAQLDNGTLTACIDIELVEETIWFPRSFDFGKQYLKFGAHAMSRDHDVFFFVEGKVIGAHKYILEKKAIGLLPFGNPSRQRSNDDIELEGVASGVVARLLECTYAGRTSSIPDFAIAKALLETANKYDCPTVKLYAESVVVSKFLDLSNAAELFILADSLVCALLKEAAMDLFAKDEGKFKANAESWKLIENAPDLVKELLEHKVRSGKPTTAEYKLDEMNVGSLRNLAQDQGLEVDGTREALVKRLKPIYEPEKPPKTDS